ncbi:protein ILRUN-like isoform X2 [Liolophura sinensis]|uniref:protein ILRUN-like isoform X2 n=1 Tax=Liolophura sinensis TaxID=3198878 RepID=UPI003158CCC3
MDVDSDIDAKLLQQFSSMGTTDREVLISEFQKLLGNQLNPTGCAFFLDMNNWNLQAAVCSYYDFEQPNVRIPLMTFIKDVTIGDGESIPPNTRFIKTWRVQNSGAESWPPGCCLKFCNGDQLGTRDRVMVEALQPGQSTDISVEMTSPCGTGVYQGQWRMSTAIGMFFGEVIWVIITVEENGLMGVTQQLSRIGGELSSQCRTEPTTNPFASPSDLNQSGPQVIEYDPCTEMTDQSEESEMS